MCTVPSLYIFYKSSPQVPPRCVSICACHCYRKFSIGFQTKKLLFYCIKNSVNLLINVQEVKILKENIIEDDIFPNSITVGALTKMKTYNILLDYNIPPVIDTLYRILLIYNKFKRVRKTRVTFATLDFFILLN